jgi:hypothetical protein
VTPTQQVFNVNEKLEKIIKPVDESLLAPVLKSPETTPNLVVIDGNGTVLPLGSEQANETIALADPYFYVGATKYTFTTSDCGADQGHAACPDPLQAAFDYIATHNLSPVGGAVYAEAATYSSTLEIDGKNWGNTAYIPLSLSLIGVTNVDKQVGSSVDHIISGTLSVQNIKSFTLQAFSIFGNTSTPVAYLANNTGVINLNDVDVRNSGTGIGLAVDFQSGAINLTNVDSSENGSVGAVLNNTTGVAAPITIKNSSFNSNGEGGFYISSNGPVTVTGVSTNSNTVNYYGGFVASRGLTVNQSMFNGNSGTGLVVVRHSLGGTVSVANSQFNNNGETGLYISQNGDVTIKNIRSTGNGSFGAFIESCNWDEDNDRCLNPLTGNVTVSQSTFTNNASVEGAAGLYVLAKGSTNLTDIIAEWNGASGSGRDTSGVMIDNNVSTILYPVNITNASFNNNFGDGLEVFSKGIITVKDISAFGNTGDGFYLINKITGSISGVNVLNSAGLVNTTSNNGMGGLVVKSNGIVVINAVKAENNGSVDGISNGIFVDNSTGTGAVTIDGVSGTVANNNNGSGVYVISKGIITVKNLEASNNHAFGYYLNNQNGTNTGVNVLGTIPRWYNNLNGNWIDGLNILSKGAVIVQKTKANSNGYYGTYIDNSQDIGTVTITDCEFNDNSLNGDTPLMEYGLFIQSKGSISVTKVRARDNGSDDNHNNIVDAGDIQAGGAWLDNSSSATPATIIITNGNFDSNFGNGLNVFSKGAVTYTTGSADNNNLTAVNIDNHLSTLNQAVTITSVNMGGNRNGTTGLIVLSKGNIAISKSDINGFNGEAVNLDNHFGTGSVSIIGELGRSRWFGYNGGNGFTINTTGGVTMNYLSTNDNGGYGIQINTTGNLSTVQLSNMDVNNNVLYGIDINAVSNITLDNVRVVDNKSYGINLDNSVGKGTVTVRATNGQEIRNNSGYGLWVISKGNITLTNIEIHDNGSFGAWLDNSTGTTGTVTINSTMYRNWGHNGDYGLQIDSPGAVIVSLVDAYENTTYGADINNTYAAGTLMPAVTITYSWFNNNHGGYGLNVDSKGNISLTDVDAHDNNGYGADLNNLLGTGTVTMTGPSDDDRNEFSNNADYGLNIQTRGAVTIKYLRTNDNAFYGTNINNSTSTLPQTVSITTANLENNSKSIPDGFGLTVLSKGAITLFEAFAGGNGRWDPTFIPANGMHLDNCLLVGGKCTGSGAVTLTSSNAWGNTGYGLDIQSYGQITLSDISAGYNNFYGGKFNNAFVKANVNPLLPDVLSTAGVTISLPVGYSSEWGYFQNNGEYGFAITSNGAVNVSGVRVFNNSYSSDSYNAAAYINNSTGTLPMAVTISNSTFYDNTAVSGIKVISKGAITYLNNSATHNTGMLAADQSAVLLDNHTSTLPQNITITNSKFNGNTSGSGLKVLTKGSVFLTNLTASNNADDGINIDASYGIGTVTMLGTGNTFNNNANRGARFTANGNVAITNITAEYNSGTGLSVDTYNSGHTGTGLVNVTNANLNRNGFYGFWSYANGAITLLNMTNSGNGSISNSDGAYMITNNKDITATNSAFISNGGRGIYSDTGAGKTLKLINTMYFGNDTNKSGDNNLSYTGLISIL